MVHSGVYLNKCGQHSAVLYNIAFTSTPHPPFRKLLFCMFPLFNFSSIFHLIFHPFLAGSADPICPYVHFVRPWITGVQNDTGTDEHGPYSSVLCQHRYQCLRSVNTGSVYESRHAAFTQRISANIVSLSHARIATFLAITMHTLQFINLPLSKCYSLGRPM